jgi:hypothetical protein
VDSLKKQWTKQAANYESITGKFAIETKVLQRQKSAGAEWRGQYLTETQKEKEAARVEITQV